MDFLTQNITKNCSSITLQEIEEIIHKHPYFAPAQIAFYLKNVEQQTNTNAIESKMALYKGNPFLLAYQKSKKEKISAQVTENSPSNTLNATAEITPIVEPVTEIKVEKIEPVLVEKPIEKSIAKEEGTTENKIMITRTFQEWLLYFKEKKQKDEKENKDKDALRAMWQKEKLAAATGEENEIVPEDVFKMAINSISQESDMASEALANILEKQEKYDKAIEMLKKLSLLYPEKSSYFASKIKNINLKNQ